MYTNFHEVFRKYPREFYALSFSKPARNFQNSSEIFHVFFHNLSKVSLCNFWKILYPRLPSSSYQYVPCNTVYFLPILAVHIFTVEELDSSGKYHSTLNFIYRLCCTVRNSIQTRWGDIFSLALTRYVVSCWRIDVPQHFKYPWFLICINSSVSSIYRRV